MTFPEAYTVSKQDRLHIRRAGWPADQWLIIWGTGESWNAGVRHPIRASELVTDDFLANDWTTVPAPLASCPITPSEPSGGGDPGPSFPGFPSEPDTFSPPKSGSSGSLGGAVSTSLPTPKPGTDLQVTFDGITGLALPPEYHDISASDLNQPFTLERSGTTWTHTFDKGFVSYDGGTTVAQTFKWTITVTNVGKVGALSDPSDTRDYFTVILFAQAVPSGGFPSGGFLQLNPEPLNEPMDSALDSAHNSFYGGHAVLSQS